MNWVDIIYILIAGMVVWVEWDRGVGLILSDILSWLIGLWVGIRVSSWLGTELAWRSGWPEYLIVAVTFFLVTVFLIFVLQKWSNQMVSKLQNQNMSSGFQHILGGSLALGYAVLVLVFATYLVDQLQFLNGFRADVESCWYYVNVYTPLMIIIG